MPKLDDATRARILELHAQGLGCNQIARQAGAAPATVSKICKDAGLTFDRSQTRAGVAARSIDVKAARTQLKLDLLQDAQRLRQQLWEPAEVINFGGKDNTLNRVTLPQPLFVEKKNIMTAVGMAVDRFAKLDALDADGGVTEAQAMIHQLIQGIGIPDE